MTSKKKSQVELQAAVGSRLREEIERLGGPSALAEALDVSRNTIYVWYTSGGIDAWQLQVLEEKGADVNYIVSGHRSESVEALAFRATARVEGVIARFDDYVFVPYYDVPVSGGDGAAALDEPPKAFNAYRKNYLQKRALLGHNLAEFPVKGYSMADELSNGDTVLVDRGITDIVGGDIYVIRQGDDLLVKFLQKLPGGDVQVISKNSEVYPPYVIKASAFESGEAAVIGRVVRQGRDR